MADPSVPFHRLGLIGYPLGHSLSPVMHRAALGASRLGGAYHLYPIPAGDKAALTELVARLRTGEIGGLNVTIPHKQMMALLVDQLSPAAQAIGAVNTLIRRDGRVIGENTDAAGFLSELRQLFPPGQPDAVNQRRPALVLGAGGAARAVVYALSQAGWQVVVAARRLEGASELAAQLSTTRQIPLQPIRLEATQLSRLGPLDLLVNATPLGMYPHVAASPWPDEIPLPESAVVYDLVYNPAETALLRRARLAGLQAVGGAGMLVEQAALSFELWTGRPALREIMRQELAAALATDYASTKRNS
jgi:shikimate dehydrogenase